MSLYFACSRSTRLIAIVLAAYLLPSTAAAQDAPPHPSPEMTAASPTVSLAGILEETLRSSPELKAARARIVATASRPERADSLPDPTVSLVYRNVGFPEFTLGDEMMSQLGVRNLAGYNRKVSDAEAKGEPIVDPMVDLTASSNRWRTRSQEKVRRT